MECYNSAMKYRIFISSVQGGDCFPVRVNRGLLGRGLVVFIPFG